MNDNNDLYLSQNEFEDVFKKHIKTSVYSLSIKTLFGERMNRKINYHPYYQRNYVWDNPKASFFIESILLGTDVPPLIFFNTGSSIEVIDGRQRYETIKKFRNDDFKLNYNGLTKLTQLKGSNFSKLDLEIKELFENAKVRVFEFEVFNEPRMNLVLEDKIKKEIFRRYNSGITPLNTAEIDNAVYDEDEITNTFKQKLNIDKDLKNKIQENYIGKINESNGLSPVLQFLRRYLVLSSFPINTYAAGSNRTEIIDLLYSVTSDNAEDPKVLCDELFTNIKITNQLIELIKVDGNKQLNETLLWGVNVLFNEGIEVRELLLDENVSFIRKEIEKNRDSFNTEKSHHYSSILQRHKSVSLIFSDIFNVDFSLYFKSDSFKNEIKDIRQSEQDAKLKLEELSLLRVQKPEPSVVPIEEIVTDLRDNKFLLRPSYQRQEKINTKKASAIIESIILGIHLPPLFIFKNKEGISEVIDGQQRLISILGFLGKYYLDEKGEKSYPKIHSFKLKDLKILHNFKGRSFDELEYSIQDKILEFKLSVIEIDYSLNKDFDPVDLFIRLNNKPYPIKENSFEMWNSIVDKDIIEKIKEVSNKNIDWFYLRKIKGGKTSDRMLNEEMITFLSYIIYNKRYREDYTSIGYYRRDGKVSCRIIDKKDVTLLLSKISTDFKLKKDFLKCLNYVCNTIDCLKGKLDNEDLKKSLNEIFSKETNIRYLVDFYILFEIMYRIEPRYLEETKFHEIKSLMNKVRNEIKNPNFEPENYQKYFEGLLDEICRPVEQIQINLE